MGVSMEDWLNNPEYLSSTLLVIMQNWYAANYNTDGTYRKDLSATCRKQYGEIKQALIALENDMHNLSIIYHQLLNVKNTTLEAGLKDLYFSNLTESYFTNIRSIYDHISCFPRIVLNEKDLEDKAAKTTSFNELLGFCDPKNTVKRQKAEKIYSENLLNSIEKSKADFENVKKIRDAIIHHGKEPVVSNSEGNILFRIPIHVGNYNSNNILPDILGFGDKEYPLMDYLQSVTIALFKNMECIGNCIGYEYIGREPSGLQYLYALIGICIKDFVNFVFPEGKRCLLNPNS